MIHMKALVVLRNCIGFGNMEAVFWSLKLILSTEQGKYFLTQLLFSTAGVVAEQHCGLN